MAPRSADRISQPPIGVVLPSKGIPASDADVQALVPFASQAGSLLAQARDVVELRQGGEAHAIEKEWLWWMVNAFADPVVVTDEQNELVLANHAAEPLFKSGKDDSAGRTHAISMNNFLFTAALSTWNLQSATERTRELTLVDPIEGSELIFEVITSPATNYRVGAKGTVSVLKNVRDLRHITQELSANIQRLQLESAVKALREGAYDYMLKLADVEELRATVARGIERRRLGQQLRERVSELEAANRTINELNDSLQERVARATVDLQHRVKELDEAKQELQASYEKLSVDQEIRIERDGLDLVLRNVPNPIIVVDNTNEIVSLNAAAERLFKQPRSPDTVGIVLTGYASQELDKLKSQFLSIASHELKTPITAMSGFVQIAVRRVKRRLAAGAPNADDWKKEEETLLEQLEVVQRQTGKLARLVDELLDASRIESGRLELRVSDVDLPELVAEVMRRHQLMAPKHDLRLSYDPDGDLNVRSDRDHLEQVLNNLIGNAMKYSPDGGAIDVTVARVGEQEIELGIADHGIGIRPEELARVFGLFYRSPDRLARDVGGMGLGLYITKEIVDRHNGRIWAETEVGQGTAFHVALPARGKREPRLPTVRLAR